MATSTNAPEFEFLPGRKAGLIEKFHIIRSHLHTDTGVIVAARYVGPITLDKRALYPALTSMLKCRRALSTQVQAAETKQPRYVSLKTVDLSQIVTFRDAEEKELYQIAEFQFKEHLSFLKETPLWRLIVLPDNTVIFHYDHSMGDGQSGLAFHRLLLTALNATSPSQDDPSPLVAIPEDLQLQPKVEEMTNTSVSFPTALKELFEVLVPPSLRKIGSSWTGKDVSKEPSTYTNMRIWNIPTKDAESLLKICRAHQCTLTSFVYTVGIVILGALLRDCPKKYKFLATDIAVSFRRYTKVPPDAFCDHVSTIHFFPRIARCSDELANDYDALAKQFPWDDAAKNAATLQKKVPKARELVGALRLLFGQYQAYFQGFMGKKREGSFQLSNLGRFPSDPSDPKDSWHIEDMFFGLCDSWLGPAIKLGVVGSQNGSVGLCFCWGTDAVEEGFAQSFVDGFKKLVEAVLHDAEAH
ncbi:hypothetical protein QCA50_004148 [Cerrena zonata]|uniref:Alcohol acetyltransferase n=1 Tax=Cerrena zonata TaxID=2478898 RepID=A0AAW0GL39_9APHY